jgi:predicted nucleotidyltransferase
MSQQSHLRYPLNAILGSEGRVRVLRELFRHGGELSSPDLAMRTKISRQHVRRALLDLEPAGIVEQVGSGKSVLWRARRAHPLAEPLDAMFRAEDKRHQEMLAAISGAAAEEAAIQAAWLYGSYARGEDKEASDLDIAVVVSAATSDGVVSRFRERLHAAADGLGFKPSVVEISPDDVLRLAQGDPWWVGVERDSMALKGGNPRTFAAKLKRDRT